MTRYAIIKYACSPEFCYDHKVASLLAGVSTHFIRRCEKEELISCRTMIYGQKGMRFKDVQKLKLIRHLHEDLGFELDAVDFLLRYRKQMKKTERQMDEMRDYIHQKERLHQAEVRALRRRLKELSGEGDRE